MLAAIALLAPVAVLPLPHRASLQWVQRDGAEACIADRALADAVTARLGAAPASDDVGLAIDGEIAPAPGGGWRATIRTRGAHGESLGERELREASGDCHAIDAKLVLVIALTVDPDLLDKPVPAPPAPPRPAIEARVPPAKPHRPWQWSAGVSGLASRGLVPGVGAGAMAAVAIEPPSLWPIELAAVVWPYDRGYAAPGGATFVQATAGVAVCPAFGATRALSACAGMQAGELRARGFGFDHDARQIDALADATAELRYDVHVTPAIAARVGIAAWVPLSRSRFVFEQAGGEVLVYQPAIVAAVTQIAVWARF